MPPFQTLVACAFMALVVVLANADTEENFPGNSQKSKQEISLERLLARAMAAHEDFLYGQAKPSKKAQAGADLLEFWKRAESGDLSKGSNFWKRSGSPAMFWKRGTGSSQMMAALRKYLSGTNKRFGDTSALASKDVQRRQEDLTRPEFNPTGW